MQDGGWNTELNAHEVFDEMQALANKGEPLTKPEFRQVLGLYAQLSEAGGVYESLMNTMRVAQLKAYNLWPAISDPEDGVGRAVPAGLQIPPALHANVGLPEKIKGSFLADTVEKGRNARSPESRRFHVKSANYVEGPSRARIAATRGKIRERELPSHQNRCRPSAARKVSPISTFGLFQHNRRSSAQITV